MPQVLIADESDIVRKVAKRILSGLNLDVLESTSANDAIVQSLSALPKYLIVDSKMDGATDVITQIRSMPGGSETHIFYCVVEADLKTLLSARRAGADDVLQKPFDRSVLLEKFQALQPAA
ncbi:PleD family two-component system response regulator [Rhizobium sp. L1K21]|uniref:response regulator n=1 Tax=Rhizobium sp. L1K21 TaxID=2954933 RepID=UPI0020931EC2|nr:response regulator [Rhizobium sp. L1K21]MCO6185143.1 response regulator [Rhizobium sp. L1K21]